LALTDVDRLISTLTRLAVKKQVIKQGMMQQLLTSKTRLPGFAGLWKWRPFGDVLVRLNAKKHQIPASSYKAVGRLPIVDQGQTAIVGYTDATRAEFAPGAEGVIVFGDHTCITKFVDFPFAIGADGTQIVRAKPGNSTRFFEYALEVDPVVSTGYNRHFKFLREKVFPVPAFPEQRAIAEVLADAESEIAAVHARLVKAAAVKAGMMQELLIGRTRLPVQEAAS
jgi:type I restriction enzyme, S subunit